MNNNNGEEKRRKEGKWTTIEWKSFHPPFLDRQLDLHIEVIRTIEESPITYHSCKKKKRKKENVLGVLVEKRENGWAKKKFVDFVGIKSTNEI